MEEDGGGQKLTVGENQSAGWVGAQDILEGLGWRRIDAQIYETRNSVIIKHDHIWKQFRLTI